MTAEAMTICTHARAALPPTLWPGALDAPIQSMAETRNIAGDFCEAATAALLDGRRIKTDARFDVCPDVMVGTHTFVESKSVGTNAQAIIYCHRMQKDIAWTANGAGELFYCLWHHRARVSAAAYAGDACTMMAATIQFACVLSLAEMAELCHARSIKILNRKTMTAAGTKLGYADHGYGVGWSVPLERMIEVCRSLVVVPVVHAAGIPMKSVSVHYSPMSKRFVESRVVRAGPRSA